MDEWTGWLIEHAKTCEFVCVKDVVVDGPIETAKKRKTPGQNQNAAGEQLFPQRRDNFAVTQCLPRNAAPDFGSFANFGTIISNVTW